MNQGLVKTFYRWRRSLHCNRKVHSNCPTQLTEALFGWVTCSWQLIWSFNYLQILADHSHASVKADRQFLARHLQCSRQASAFTCTKHVYYYSHRAQPCAHDCILSWASWNKCLRGNAVKIANPTDFHVCINSWLLILFWSEFNMRIIWEWSWIKLFSTLLTS